jgi:hypothetical protein
MYRLPVHYTKSKFAMEFFSEASALAFVEEYAEHISFCD